MGTGGGYASLNELLSVLGIKKYESENVYEFRTLSW